MMQGRGPAVSRHRVAKCPCGDRVHAATMARMSDRAEDRRRALALVRAHGRDATSFQALEPGLEYWFDGPDACVAFARVGRARVATGGPIAPLAREVEVMGRFVAVARAAGERVCFFAVERPPAAGSGFARLHVGQEPVWDPQHWNDVLRLRRSLREQLRRARAKGVVVRRADPAVVEDATHPTRHAIEALIARWVARRRMAPMQFVVALEPFDFAADRRYFLAERDESLLGLLVAVPVPARGGWLFEDVLRDPRAPNGSVELLIDAAMRALAEEGAREVTFGLAPLAEVSSTLLRVCRRLSRAAYDFDGLFAFKAKLGPRAWRPVYVVWPTGRSAAFALCDVLRAFAGGSLVRFGWRTLMHRAPAVVRLFAVMLVPWTLALAAHPSWFPAPLVQWGWIALDLALIAALFRLAARWSPALAVALAVVAALDFVLGTLQLLLFNLATLHGAIEVLVVAAALLAPLLAAIVLGAAASRRR